MAERLARPSDRRGVYVEDLGDNVEIIAIGSDGIRLIDMRVHKSVYEKRIVTKIQRWLDRKHPSRKLASI